MAKTIFLEFDEEVVSALQKIKRAGEDDVVLVIPKGARIFRTLTGLKLLLFESKKIGKQISVSSADSRGRVLCKRAGIRISTEVMPDITSQSVIKRTRQKRIGDIIKRPPVQKNQSVSPKPEAREHEETEDLSDLIGPGDDNTDIKIPKPVSVPLKNYKYSILGGVLLVAGLATLFFYVLPQADIKVSARSEQISRDLEILVDSQLDLPDLQNLAIPGVRVSEEISFENVYPTTGTQNEGEKASGFVTLYNFSNNNLILRSNTTRLEADGKTFYFLQDIGRVRPTSRNAQGEVIASSLNDPFPIVAAEPGAEYNITEGTQFEVINEVFGHQPEILYAINTNAVAGGSDEEVTVLSEEDIALARASSTEEILKILQDNLRDKISENIKVEQTATSVEVLEEFVDSEVGQEVDEFRFAQKVMVNALLYDESYAQDLVVERIVRQLPENKSLMDTFELEAEFISLDLSAGAGTLRVHLDSEILYQIDGDFLKRNLSGKSAIEVKEVLLSRPEIQDVEVTLSPFWVNKVPRFESKINFEVIE